MLWTMTGVSCNETSMQSILSYLGGLTAGNASHHDQCGVATVNTHLMEADWKGPTNAVPAGHMEKGATLSCASIEVIKGFPQIQTGELCGDSEMLTDFRLKQLYGNLNLCLEGSAANITHKLDLNTSGTAENSLTVLDHDLNGMNFASSEDPSNGGHSAIGQSHLAVTVAAPAKPSEFHGLHGAVPRTTSTSKSAMNHRIRRARISKAVKELEELVPKSGKYGRESVLDEAIEYVKLLKLQVQLLSQSRVGGEAPSDPFINIKGYGHYLLHDEMVGEPLEELMGQLMETNIAAASHLLERKGLYVIPMALAHDLLQTE